MNATVIAIFVFIVGITLVITYYAAKRTNSASDFYTAGGGLTGWQNGLAIAGDYLSAASFLGIAGAIALFLIDILEIFPFPFSAILSQPLMAFFSPSATLSLIW